MDEETGLYYYGARYYSPKPSVWLSVDPLAHEFPWQSPYVFTDNNSVNLVDPNGMAAGGPGDPNNEFKGQYVGPEAIVTARKPLHLDLNINPQSSTGTRYDNVLPLPEISAEGRIDKMSTTNGVGGFGVRNSVSGASKAKGSSSAIDFNITGFEGLRHIKF